METAGTMIKLLTTFLLVMPAFSHAGTTTLRCAKDNAVCYITAFPKDTKQVRNLTLKGGDVYEYSGVKAGDQFCIDTRVPNNPDTCSRITLSESDVNR
jgi:hypothetical protein